MKRYKVVLFGFAVIFAACEVSTSTPNEVIEFGNILEPHYKSVVNEINCDDVKDVTIPVFGERGQTLSFRYGLCANNNEREMVDFSYKSEFMFLEDYVFGKYKFLTPESAFRINPNAEQYTYLDIPIFGVTKLGQVSPQEYLKSKNNVHKSDWSICEIKKWGKHIWGLENPSFKEVPAETYTIDNYASVSEWKLNHEADKAKYRDQFGEQKLKNRACANEQHYWYVAKDGILITIPNPANYTGGINPTTITYNDNR